MISRRQALAMSSPALGLLLVTLGWNAWDYRAALLGRLRDIARL